MALLSLTLVVIQPVREQKKFLMRKKLNRVIPAIKIILKEFPAARLSIDTFRASIASAAVNEGATMINDVSGGELDTAMFKTVAKLKAPYVLMHMRGNPQTMTSQISYQNLIKEMSDFFHAKIHALTQLGVKDIIVDPGFGFAKTREQNFDLLKNLSAFQLLGRPLLAGLSRKITHLEDIRYYRQKLHSMAPRH